MLEYSVRENERRWVWDEDDISSMNITGNVLYLLSSKMSGLSKNIQSVIKSVACFGIKIKECVVEKLGNDSDLLERIVGEGFIAKVGNLEFKFLV